MFIENARHVFISGLTVCVASVITPAGALAQDAASLPDKAKSIVMVGCLERRDTEHHKSVLVLANPTIGYATAKPTPNCTSSPSDPILELKDVKRTSLDDSMLGHWIEVRGGLRRQPGGDDFRELHLVASRLVPIEAPRAAEAAPAPQFEPPAPQAEAAPETPAPIATTGVEETKQLPKTASTLPFALLAGFVALGGAGALHLLRRRRPTI
jgi:LPXTG-motif cell wall-anchored protein